MIEICPACNRPWYKSSKHSIPSPKRKLSVQKVKAMRYLAGKGCTISYIAKRFGVLRGIVHAVINRKTYKDIK